MLICSVTRLIDALKGQRLDLSLEELVLLGSAVVKDVRSSSTTDIHATSLLAILPTLKPMLEDCFSVAISRLIFEVITKKVSKSHYIVHDQVCVYI